MLKEHQIEVVKILNKYYIWYEEGIPNPTDILRYIFSQTTHKIINLQRIDDFNIRNLKQFKEHYRT